MAGLFKFNLRAVRIRLQMHVCFQCERFWVARQPIAKPTEIGSIVRSIGRIKRIDILLKVCATERYPYSPSEITIHADYRNPKNGSYEKIFVVNGTKVIGFHGNCKLLFVRQYVVIVRGSENKIRKPFVPFRTGCAFESEIEYWIVLFTLEVVHRSEERRVGKAW